MINKLNIFKKTFVFLVSFQLVFTPFYPSVLVLAQEDYTESPDSPYETSYESPYEASPQETWEYPTPEWSYSPPEDPVDSGSPAEVAPSDTPQESEITYANPSQEYETPLDSLGDLSYDTPFTPSYETPVDDYVAPGEREYETPSETYETPQATSDDYFTYTGPYDTPPDFDASVATEDIAVTSEDPYQALGVPSETGDNLYEVPAVGEDSVLPDSNERAEVIEAPFSTQPSTYEIDNTIIENSTDQDLALDLYLEGEQQIIDEINYEDEPEIREEQSFEGETVQVYAASYPGQAVGFFENVAAFVNSTAQSNIIDPINLLLSGTPESDLSPESIPTVETAVAESVETEQDQFIEALGTTDLEQANAAVTELLKLPSDTPQDQLQQSLDSKLAGTGLDFDVDISKGEFSLRDKYAEYEDKLFISDCSVDSSGCSQVAESNFGVASSLASFALDVITFGAFGRNERYNEIKENEVPALLTMRESIGLPDFSYSISDGSPERARSELNQLTSLQQDFNQLLHGKYESTEELYQAVDAQSKYGLSPEQFQQMQTVFSDPSKYNDLLEYKENLRNTEKTVREEAIYDLGFELMLNLGAGPVRKLNEFAGSLTGNAAEEIIEGGAVAGIKGLASQVFKSGDEAIEDVLEKGTPVWAGIDDIALACDSPCGFSLKGLLGLDKDELPVQSGVPGGGYVVARGEANKMLHFPDDPENQVMIMTGDYTREYYTVGSKALDYAGRVVVPIRDGEGNVSMAYLSTSEGEFKRFVGIRDDGWVIKPDADKYYENQKVVASVPFELDRKIKELMNDGDIKVIERDDGKIRNMLQDAGYVYPDAKRGAVAMGKVLDDSGLEIEEYNPAVVSDLNFNRPTDAVKNGTDRVDVYFKASECECRVVYSFTADKAPFVAVNPDGPKGFSAFDFSIRPDSPNAVFDAPPTLARTQAANVAAPDKQNAVEALNGWQEIADRVRNSDVYNVYQQIVEKHTSPNGGYNAKAAADEFQQVVETRAAQLNRDPVERYVPPQQPQQLDNGQWVSTGQNSPGRTPSISQASNFDELFEAIDTKGGVQGNQRNYSPEELKYVVTQVASGNLPLESVTRSEGLRDSVQRIISDTNRRSYIPSRAQVTNLASTDTNKSIFAVLIDFFINEARAQGDETASLSDLNLNSPLTLTGYAIAKTKEDIRHKFDLGEKVSLNYFKGTLVSNLVIKPEGYKTEKGIAMITDNSGLAQFPVQKGLYKVSAASIHGTQLTIPEYIDITNPSEVLLVAVRAGNGEVKMEESLVRHSDMTEGNAQLKVVVFYDKNGNAKWDETEKIAPWGGVGVSLEKVNRNSFLSLVQGWNLITLNSLPEKTVTASGLIVDVAKQGGYITTVSTLDNGVWRSHLVRGDKMFSGDDFVIEPGKAYFVKATRTSIYKIQGREFVVPVKLDLKRGWNTVGVPYADKRYRADNLATDLVVGKTKTVTIARFSSGLWDAYVSVDKEKYGNDFFIEPTKGYIVKLEQDMSFSP